MRGFDEWWADRIEAAKGQPHLQRLLDPVVKDWAKTSWDAAKREVYGFVGLSDGARCVLQRWAWSLPLMQQTVLLCSLRGPDGTPKDSHAKRIVRLLRLAVIHNARPLEQSDFMAQTTPLGFQEMREDFFKDADSYPMHFLLHLVHAAEIVGYKHPDPITRGRWGLFYQDACNSFHMQPEHEEELDERLAL